MMGRRDGTARDLFSPYPSGMRFNRRRWQLQGAVNQLRRLMIARLMSPSIGTASSPVGRRPSFGFISSRGGVLFPGTLPGALWPRDLQIAHDLRRQALFACHAHARDPRLYAGFGQCRGVDRSGGAWRQSLRQRSGSGHWRLTTESPCISLWANQRGQLPAVPARSHNATRPIIETVNRQLSEKFGVKSAQSVWNLNAHDRHNRPPIRSPFSGAAEILRIRSFALPKPT